MSNSISFLGNLARAAEAKTVGEYDVLEFSVANNVGFGDKQTTNWFRCTKFGKAGGIAQYLVKGSKVFITGQLTIRKYDKKDGGEAYSFDVKVDNITLAGGKSDDAINPGRDSRASSKAASNDDDMPF